MGSLLWSWNPGVPFCRAQRPRRPQAACWSVSHADRAGYAPRGEDPDDRAVTIPDIGRWGGICTAERGSRGDRRAPGLAWRIRGFHTCFASECAAFACRPTAVIAVTTLSTGALPAHADKGGNGRGAEHSTAKKDKDEKNGQGARPEQGRPEGRRQGRRAREGAQARQGQGSPRRRPSPTRPRASPRRRPARQGQGKPDKGTKPSPGKSGGKDRVPATTAPSRSRRSARRTARRNNHPHVGCSFQIKWSGYDKGDDIVSPVSFAMHARPSNVGAVACPGRHLYSWAATPPAAPARPPGLDSHEIYTLSFDGAGHPKQGYHVKLAVTTPCSQGNDTKPRCSGSRGARTQRSPGDEPPTEEPPTRGAAGGAAAGP